VTDPRARSDAAGDDLGFVHEYREPSRPDAPILFLLHGTGGDERDLIPLGEALDPGAGILSPRGKVLERGMPRFFRRLAEGVFDIPDLKARAAELAAFLQRARDRYRFGDRLLVAVGFSNGANIAGAVLLLQPGTLDAAVLIRAMVPLVPDRLPALEGTPVLILNGRRDPMAPPPQTERLAELLRSAGARAELTWIDAGHELTAADVARARDWISTLGRSRV
jgi:predicted esterase